MDQYTRRIIGFGVHAGSVDGPTLCRMFSDATSGRGWEQVTAPIAEGQTDAARGHVHKLETNR